MEIGRRGGSGYGYGFEFGSEFEFGGTGRDREGGDGRVKGGGGGMWVPCTHVHWPGGERVDPDSQRRQLHCHLLGQAMDARLAGAVPVTGEGWWRGSVSNVNVYSLGLSNATEEQQVYSSIWDMHMLQGVYKYRVQLIAPSAAGNV
jgi:hypothetical protein